ncbi:MAG: hypothetical protein KAZ33_03245 [Comamonas sp.]|nr:hypothetical protein [Comamonas sp.]
MAHAEVLIRGGKNKKFDPVGRFIKIETEVVVANFMVFYLCSIFGTQNPYQCGVERCAKCCGCFGQQLFLKHEKTLSTHCAELKISFQNPGQQASHTA